MSTSIFPAAISSRLIRRPIVGFASSVNEIDETVETHLDELNALLVKRIFTHPKKGWHPEINSIIKRDLTPKHVPPLTGQGGVPRKWEADSLAATFAYAAPGKLSLADYIDQTPELANLKYALEERFSNSRSSLPNTARAVLDDHPGITNYLIVFAHNIGKIRDVHSLVNYLLSNADGVKKIANYAIVSAARSLIAKEQINVPNYNHDDSAIVEVLKNAGLSLTANSFRNGAHAVISDYIFNRKESDLIDAFNDAGLGPVPVALRAQLIKYMQASPIVLDDTNANTWIPILLQQIQGNAIVAQPTEVDAVESDKDFEVADFLSDDSSLIEVSRSAVKCASQLYFSMVIGDELDVFNVANYFTHKYLIRGGMEILDRNLRDDLQLYVFSNKFTDLKSKKIEDRTRPAERQMFYRQVFNEGNGQITDDVIVNTEFPRLWKILILESAKYLERAQSTFNQDTLSLQNVMQAIEDLQYNLSTHCTGMANVITPLIYEELNFVIERIFKHQEVMRQVVPQGGTWWRVVETLYMGMKNSRPRSTVIYNKASLGNKILRAIADYNPSDFENDKNSNEFISLVDAFITTQSILQESITDSLKKGDAEEEASHKGYNGNNGYSDSMPDVPAMAAASGPKAGADEWDF